ncbi:hypothetical protein [Thalassotalea sp. Y01]|uniref:hypothetical protein n=1 Tax=Thalassotalea sp. Y01 TaxID=2729613 RepID=UPI00145D2E6D|nr:hypothetical protein [Thalassotalea sp. Y01]NMP16232.1 transposase family protein [Thalassotalea sp. Y01]
MFYEECRAYRIDGVIYRLLQMTDETFVLVDVLSEKDVPRHFDRKEIELALAKECNDRLEFDEDPWWDHQHREYSENHEHVKKRDEILARIAPIINHPDCFDSAVRGKLIALLEAEGMGSRSTIYRNCRRYWQRGMSPNALLPDLPNCGGKGKSKTRGEKPLGAPSSIDPRKTEQLSEGIKKMMRASLNATRFSGKYRSLAKGKKKNMSFLKFAYHDFTLRYCDGDPSKVDKGLPKESLLKSFYYNNYDHETQERTNVGDKNFNANNRLLTSTIRENGGYPGKTYVIDSTPIDIGTANEERLPGARPTLYACVDEFTSACVGFWLVLTPPSYINVVHCLKMAMEGSSKLCKKLGFFVDMRDFPFSGKPEEIFADLGADFKTKNMNALVTVHNVAIKHSGAGQPDKRPSVEKFFDRLHGEILHKVPGVVSEYSSKKSGGQDSRENYSLLLKELYEVVIDAVVTLNNTPLSDFDDDGDYPGGMSTTPIDIWHWGIPHRGKKLPAIDGDQFFFTMLKREEATRHRNVLKIDGIRFLCKKFSGIRRKIRGGHENYQVVRDPMDASQIWLVPEEGKSKYIECEIHPKDRGHKCRTWTDVLAYDKARKIKNAEKKRENLKKLVVSNPKQVAMLKNAELENKKAVKGLTKQQKLAGLSDKEGHRQRSQSIYNLSTPSSSSEHVLSMDELKFIPAELSDATDAKQKSARTQRFMK